MMSFCTKKCLFWVLLHTSGVKCPKTSILGAWMGQQAKYKNLHIIKTTAPTANKLFTAT